MAHHSTKIREPKAPAGSLSNKYPIVLDGGKTIIYISDKSKEAEVRARYERSRQIVED